MQFRILGSLEAVAGGVVADLGPPKQCAFLAILIIHAGEIVPCDRLIDLLWNDRAPRTAAHSLQIYVSALRKELEPLAGPGVIRTRHPGYQLTAPSASIDAREFERLVQAGLRELGMGRQEHAATFLRSALSLWRGPPLSDFTYEEFAQPMIHRLHDLRLDAIERLAAVELQANRVTDALLLLEAAVDDEPLREGFHALLMLALYRAGRSADALRKYEAVRRLLADDLGLEPSPTLEDLAARIRRHDPSLLTTSRWPVVHASQRRRTVRRPVPPHAGAHVPLRVRRRTTAT